MKSVTGIDRPYIYIVLGLIVVLALGLLEMSKFLDIDIIDIAGLRLLAISLSTVVGILIGLVAVTVTSIVRVSISQKQFYQGMLASESQWFKDWLAAHAIVAGQLGRNWHLRLLLLLCL